MVRPGTRRQQTLRPPSDQPAQPGLLPLPPSDDEKYAYPKRRLWMLTVTSMVSVSCPALSQFRLASSSPLLWLFAPLLTFTVLYYLISLRVNLCSRDFDVERHRRLVGAWRPGTYPSVDVFLPVCGEPIEVLHNTWTHVRMLADDYPGPCEPFALDDSASYRLEAWAVRMMYGWAHVFAIWDILRGRRMGWQATGSAAAKRSGITRHRTAVWLWGGGTAVLWVAAAGWRTLMPDPADFALLLSSGLFYALIVGRVLVQPRAMGAH
ncbi:hypothetical protein B1C81_12435 [Streptomyces sp. HG99]|nr:hypothetical protein B1C81_12435 [Streptomyces sp. HG99]